MNFLNTGIPIGEYWGITVRLHFTLLLYAVALATGYGNLGYGLMIVAGLWLCILLHEFGHALAARWCDGECDEIMLWPLGGLAFARPAWSPTAHLITTVAGPFVTLVLWLLFAGISWWLDHVVSGVVTIPVAVRVFVRSMEYWNLRLLIFNVCVPAFPMDGGRMLRDTLWHFMSAETATKIAVRLSQLIGVTAVAWAIMLWIAPNAVPGAPLGFGPIGMLIIAAFILSQTAHEQQIVSAEAGGAYTFSLRERIHRGRRRRAFHKAIQQRAAEEADRPFHTCAECGQTDRDSPSLEFRVCDECANGEEYCPKHLHQHTHR